MADGKFNADLLVSDDEQGSGQVYGHRSKYGRGFLYVLLRGPQGGVLALRNEECEEDEVQKVMLDGQG